jgi:hypothetical protein
MKESCPSDLCNVCCAQSTRFCHVQGDSAACGRPHMTPLTMHLGPTTTSALHRGLLRQYCRCATQLVTDHQCTQRDPIYACSARAAERRTLIWLRNATLRRSDFKGVLQMRQTSAAR